jgi:hypothetical protein
MAQITGFLWLLITTVSFFLWLHLTRNNALIYLKKPVREDFFGARLDAHSVAHFYFGFLLCWVFNIWIALCVNFYWEIWDRFKETSPIKLEEGASWTDKITNWLHNNILVSEGHFDIADFLIMAFGSILAWTVKTTLENHLI